MEQRRKIDRVKEKNEFLLSDLVARDELVQALQHENQELLQDRNHLRDQVSMQKTLFDQKSAACEQLECKIKILEEQLKQRSLFEHQLIQRIEAQN